MNEMKSLTLNGTKYDSFPDQTAEKAVNKVTVIDQNSDDEHYPTAKAVYDAISGIEPGTGGGTVIEVDGVPFTFTHGKNLIDASAVVSGEVCTSAGVIAENSSYQRTNYILLTPGDYVYSNRTTVGSNFSYVLFDLEKTFIGRYTANPFTIEESCYIVINDIASQSNLQLEAGTEATEYEAYYSKMKGVIIGGEDIEDGSIPAEKLGFDIADMVKIPDGSITPKKLSFMSYGKNLIDESKNVIGEVCNSFGAIATNASFRRTDYIYLEPGDYVYSNWRDAVSTQFRWCQYDLNKTFAAYYQTAAISITEPCYIMIGDNINDGRIMQLEAGTEPTEYEPYTVTMEGIYTDVSEQVSQGHFKKKTILFDGDSITEGTGFTADECKTIIYPALVANALGMNLVNHAIGGSTAASKNPESDNTKQPMVLRFEDYTEDADIIYVAIGTNDWAYSYTEIGSMEDREDVLNDDGTSKATPYTFYGALHMICRGLLNKYPGKAIIFATPIKRRLQESDTNPDAAVRNGKTLKEYGEIIKEVCDWYSIPVIDMYSECNITPFIDEQRNAFFMETSGGTHPNAAGHAVLARRVTAGIRSIVGL